MAAELRVLLLGPTTVVVDGLEVPVAGAPQRTVLARLALSAPRPVSHAALVDALWPDDPPGNASGNLQSYISRLRRTIGADVVVRDAAGYRLQVPAEAIDLVQFEVLADRARAIEPPDLRAEAFAEVLALWRGEPFDDVGTADAFGPDRTRLAVVHQQAVEGWLAARVDAGDAAGALGELEQAAAVDPHRESIHLILARALHALGRTADALRVVAEFRARTIDETGMDPSPALADLERRILADDPALRPIGRLAPRPSASVPGSRHAPSDRFVGREQELSAVAAGLAERRLVTVVGPGGAGKTRLAKEVVDRTASGEVVGVRLAPISRDHEVASAAAGALGLRVAPDGLAAALADLVAHRELTVILDNCEHVVGGARALAELLVESGPGVRVLATSRVPLGAPGEQVIQIGPLDEDAQVELFCDRAALLRPAFDPSPEERPLLASICRQLDGLPLALELAARREATFGLAQLEAQLTSGLEIIEPGDDEEGRGVVAAVGWSYRLLRPGARALFDRLAVCRGGFPLEAVLALAPSGAGNRAADLAELVDASLVEVDLQARPPRYRQLEVMRRVGLGHLDPEELAEARRVHRSWMREHMDRCAALQAVRSPQAIELLRSESANLSAALSIDDGADRADVAEMAVVTAALLGDDPNLELLAQLRRLEPWTDAGDEVAALCAIGCGAAALLSGESVLAQRLLDQAIATLPPEHPHRWVGLFCRGSNGMFLGQTASVEDDARELALDPAAPDWARAMGVASAALINLYRGDTDRADQWMAEYADLLDAVADIEPFVSFSRGELDAERDPEQALEWYDESIRASELGHFTYNRETCRVGRAAALVRLGRQAEAAEACAAAIEATARVGMWPQAWTALRLAGELLADSGDPVAAATILSASARDPLAPEVLEIDRSRQDLAWSSIHEQLTDEELRSARLAGERIDRSRLVAVAVDALTG